MTSANNSEKRVLVLRTSDKKGRGRGGFQWPTSGHVEAPDWVDGGRLGHRIATGYVGEDGIEPNVAYKLDSNGRFVKVGS